MRSLRKAAAITGAIALGATAAYAPSALSAAPTGVSNVDTVVGPRTFTQVKLVDDMSDGVLDMAGAPRGKLRYEQDGSGAVDLTVKANGLNSGESFDVYLTAGPSHDVATGFIEIGSVNADATGHLNHTFAVSIADLNSLGSGYNTDHLDMIGSSGAVIVAGAVNFYTSPVSPTADQSNVGDPTS